MSDDSKEKTIKFFIDALLSFVNVLDYVQEYVQLHKDDGDFNELYDTLHDLEEIYLRKIKEFDDELKM